MPSGGVDKRCLDAVTRHYLASRDFNGMSLDALRRQKRLSKAVTRATVAELVHQGLVSVNCDQTNPFIKAFPEKSVERQLSDLEKAELTCVYPSQAHLRTVVDVALYDGKPFTLRLALGEPQFTHVAFDTSVLEIYRNDPRYSYACDDVEGKIFFDHGDIVERSARGRDDTFLETFGFAFDREENRAAAAFLRYLSKFTAEHQQIWWARRHDGEWTLHPGYLHITLGIDDEHISVFDAVLEEQRVINAATTAMGFGPLFRQVPTAHDRPRDFGFILRPTLREYQLFVLCLDKLMSDNIRRGFFPDSIRRRRDSDAREKGTIEMLEDWLDGWFWRVPENTRKDVVEAFRTVRRERQAPAHKIEPDNYDGKYLKDQRILVARSCGALRLLRLILVPFAGEGKMDVPSALQESKIWFY